MPILNKYRILKNIIIKSGINYIKKISEIFRFRLWNKCLVQPNEQKMCKYMSTYFCNVYM